MGWTVVGGAAPVQKCIILGVPHTSAMDFVVSYLFYTSIGHKARIMIKKEFFFWPVGVFLRKVGCIPVDRSNGASVVMSVISEAERTTEEFHLCIAPEGTRKAVKKWKMGYHKIAKAVGCPVYMGYFDWGRKRISIGETVELTDDARADTDRIQAMYEELKLQGKVPENYCTH